MADKILVQGARDVAPKFTDFGKDFADRFKETYGNAVVLRQQQLELEKKENEIRSKDFLSVDNIDLTTVGEDVLDSTSKEAFKIKDEAFDLIKRKDEIGVTEYNIQLAKLQNKVKGLNSLMKMKKSLGSDYTNVARNIEMAPWGNPQNKAALIAAIDLNTKKEWVEKDGKYFLSTDGGKTLIDLASISPVEAADKSILLKLEDAAFGRLKKRSLTSGSLTDERIRDVAAKTVNSISDEDVKNAALGYFLKDKTRSEQEAYYAITPMAKIRKDVEDTLYLRDLSLYAKELNEIRKPKPSKTDPSTSKNSYGLTTSETKYIDTFLNPILKDKNFNEGAANIIERTTGNKTKVDPKTNYFQILDDEGNIEMEYNLLKPESIEKFFKDTYGGTEEQATSANMKLAAPYAFDKISKFFNPKNSSLSPSLKASDLLAKYSKQNN